MNCKARIKYHLPLAASIVTLVMPITVGIVHACETNVESYYDSSDYQTRYGSTRSFSSDDNDKLDTYIEDLSSFGKSARIVASESEVADLKSNLIADETPARMLAVAELRVIFQSDDFQHVDQLGTYMEDLSSFGKPSPSSRILALAGEERIAHSAKSFTVSSRYVENSSSLSDRPTGTSTEDLNTYVEDLSEFGRSAQFQTSVGNASRPSSPSRLSPPTQSPEPVDLVALKAWMRTSEFEAVDGLGTYMEDFRTRTLVAEVTDQRVR